MTRRNGVFPLALLALCCLALSACSSRGRVEVVLSTLPPEAHQAAAPTPEPSEEAEPTPTAEPAPKPTPVFEGFDPVRYTPPQFLSGELFEKEKSPIINPKKASYARFGLDPEAMRAFEDEASAGKRLPIIHVSTEDGEYILSRTQYSSCVIDVFNCPEEQRLSEGSAGIRVRGNSSGFYGDAEKIKANPVPYRIKFDKKTNLLGLNGGAKCKSWVLLKSGFDLIRNDIALRFGRAIMGDHAFCSDSAYVHLYVNGVYQGLYTLCEQCQVNEHRVDLYEAGEDYVGIDIGYYMVIDNNPEPPYSFSMDYGKHRMTDIEGVVRDFVRSDYTVKSDVATSGQVAFISQYMNNVFEIVFQACEKGKLFALDANCELAAAPYQSVRETVGAVLDLESVVNMYLLYEIMHDYDVGEGSFYMCVDFSADSNCPKLQFTSPWDFNWTCEGRSDRYWAGSFSEASFVGVSGDRSNPWFVLLIKQDWFREMVSEKWTALAEKRSVRACVDAEIDILDSCSDELNTARKGSVQGAYNVILWLNRRLDWMDSQFLPGDQTVRHSR